MKQLSIVVCFLLCTLFPIISNAQSSWDRAESAILNERWDELLELLHHVSPETKSCVARMLKGFACLAKNRNNEAVEIFSRLDSPEELQKWRNWAEKFAMKNPRNPIAFLFWGDALMRLEKEDPAIALMRLEKEDPAIEKFTEALKFAPKHPLILNARGVAYASKRKFLEAVSDLESAKSGSLADVYCNLAMLNIAQQESPQDGIENLDQALKISPCFALALYARACLKTVLDQLEEAKKDTDQALQCDAKVITKYIASLRQYLLDEENPELAKNDRKAAMAIQQKLEQIKKGDLGFFGKNVTDVTRAAAKDSAVMKQLKDICQEIGKKDLVLARQISSKMDRIINSQEKHINNWTGRTTTNTVRLGGDIKAAGINPQTGTVGTASIKGDITHSSTQTHNHRVQEHKKLADTCKELKTILPPSKAQGIDGSPHGTFDEGNWPFEPIYSLFYKIEPAPSHSSEE